MTGSSFSRKTLPGVVHADDNILAIRLFDVIDISFYVNTYRAGQSGRPARRLQTARR